MSNNLKKRNSDGEKGFSLIEAVVAIMILSIGLIGTAASITFALKFTSVSRNVTNGKLVATSMIEEIDSLRNTRRLDFQQIANVGAVDNSSSANTFNGFSTDFQSISISPGPDGVNGTADDLTDAGKDGSYGTMDDFTNPELIKSGYTRQITISSLNDNLKKIEIKIRYFSAGGGSGELSAVSYLNNEVRTNN